MDWTPPPEPMTWVLPRPIQFGSASYPTITLRAPSAGDILKAGAIPGSSEVQINLRLISVLSVEQVPYEALAMPSPDGLPAHLMGQMGAYIDMFGGAPLPGPLEEWRKAQVAAARAASQPT